MFCHGHTAPVHRHHLSLRVKITCSIKEYITNKTIQIKSRLGIKGRIEGLPTWPVRLRVIIKQLPHTTPGQWLQ